MALYLIQIVTGIRIILWVSEIVSISLLLVGFIRDPKNNEDKQALWLALKTLTGWIIINTLLLIFFPSRDVVMYWLE